VSTDGGFWMGIAYYVSQTSGFTPSRFNLRRVRVNFFKDHLVATQLEPGNYFVVPNIMNQDGTMGTPFPEQMVTVT
jgi:hypothetical protein